MLPKTLTFIDVETTGMSPLRDRIIEIGMLRVEKGKVVNTFETLINPECSIPPEITMLTGISGRELENAPTFYSIKNIVREFIHDAVFVAHNARFDYSFIKSEFARHEESFTAKLLCTAKLSRILYPESRHHNLDSIIERFGINCQARHRAYGDAQVLWEFIQIVHRTIDPVVLTDVLKTVMKRPTLPPTIPESIVNNIPEKAGVYIFYNESGAPLYIGKSINLKDRILSHFLNAPKENKELKIFRSIYSLETIQTEGELGALLLESELIKKHQPMLNRQLRRSSNFIGLIKKQMKDGYYSVDPFELKDVTLDNLSSVLAVFKTNAQWKKQLTELATEHNLCLKLLGIEKTKKSCFGYHLGTCKGACIGNEIPAKYNMRFTEAFARTRIRQWPFSGPIAIREGKAVHVVFQWCYLGKLNSEINSGPDPGDIAIFDYDAYKILSSYILNPTNQQKIRILKTSRITESEW